jgi:hypothetical protein
MLFGKRGSYACATMKVDLQSHNEVLSNET